MFNAKESMSKPCLHDEQVHDTLEEQFQQQVFNMPFDAFLQSLCIPTEENDQLTIEMQKVYAVLTKINKRVTSLKSSFEEEMQ